jgi:hypothetical protein
MRGSAELTGNYNASTTTATGGDGGAVRVVGGIFRMTGDDTKVYNNYAGRYGGGVYLDGEAHFTMSGENAAISGNTAAGDGGGVYVNDGAFTMEGGEFFGNKAIGSTSPNYAGSGGGVYIGANPNNSFTMTGGTVYGYLGGTDLKRNEAGNGDVDLDGNAVAAFFGGNPVSLPKGGTVGGVPIVLGGTQGNTSETVRAPYDGPPSSTIPVTGITLNPTSITLYPPGDARGDSAILTVTVSPANATNPALNWDSSNDSVVSVSSSGGTVTVTAVSAGAATITATATDGSGKTATCEVTVLSMISGGGSDFPSTP